MALFNYATKEITLKIVYYGPGLSGKTTNIEYLHTSLDQTSKGKLLSLSTEADRTLFFDFLPVEIGKIKEFSIRFQLYTVPGQVRYNSTRKLVLKGADAVVFVADSQRDMQGANIESLENMRENLSANDLDPDDIPVILQFNKRDLPNLLSIDELNSVLNKKGYGYFEAVATRGEGVHETFKSVTKLVLKHIAQKHKIDINEKEVPTPSPRPTRGAPVIKSPRSEPSPTPPMPVFDMVGSEEIGVEKVQGLQDHDSVLEKSASKEFDPGDVFPDETDKETVEIDETDDKSIESIYKAFMSDENNEPSSFDSAGMKDFELEVEETALPKAPPAPKAPSAPKATDPEENRKDAFSESLKSFRASFQSSYDDNKDESTGFSIDRKDIFADFEESAAKSEEPLESTQSPIKPTSLAEDAPVTFEEPPAFSQQRTEASKPTPSSGTGNETFNVVLDEINSVARTLRKLNDSMTSLKAEIASISRKVNDIEERVESFQNVTIENPISANEVSNAPAPIPDEFFDAISSLKQDIENAKKKKLWFLFS